MTTSRDPWSSFTHDPRVASHAPLRASDSDRDVVAGVLTEAYADGRLDREEFDTRSAAAASARTLGELPALVADLVAVGPPGALARIPADDLQQRAVARYESDRREAVLGFLGPSIVCVVIWWVLGFGGFFWPAFVIAGTGINLMRTLMTRQDLIERNRRKLEKKQAMKPDPEPGGDPGSDPGQAGSNR